MFTFMFKSKFKRSSLLRRLAELKPVKQLKIPTAVGKGQHKDMFSNPLALMKFFLVGMAEEYPTY